MTDRELQPSAQTLPLLTPGAPARDARAMWMLVALAGLAFLAHMLVAGNYGYFRDELYYIADGMHLQAGYVDQPALLGWLAALMRVLAGDNLVAIHIIPALAHAFLVVVTGLMARELGGGRAACLIAGAAALFSVNFLAAGSIFSMDVLDQLWWALASLFLVRLLRRQDPRQWLLFGLVVAAGFLTKLTILFFGLAVLLALLVTPERRLLGTRWPWLAFGIGMIGLLPYVVWNALNAWQTLDFYRSYHYLTTGPITFFANQILLTNPISFPLVIAGVVFYFSKSGARYRVLGWTFVFAYLVLTVVHGKPYFLGPAYPILFAAGAMTFERASLRPRLTWIKPVYLAALALVGIVLAPVAMPILPPAVFARIYGSQAGIANAAAAQSGAAVLPQNLSDRLGWDTLTETVGQVYNSLTPGEKAQACVIAGNYGEAGALSLLAAPGRLPPIVSGHNNNTSGDRALAREKFSLWWDYRKTPSRPRAPFTTR